MHLPLPKILYTFANSKKEYMLKDLGEGQLDLVASADFKWKTSSRNEFGLPNHSMEWVSGELTADISAATSSLTEMSILFHYTTTTPTNKILTISNNANTDCYQLRVGEDFWLELK